MSLMPEVLTVPEAAMYLQLGKDAVYKLAQEGTLPAKKIRGKWRFSRVALKQFMHSEAMKNCSSMAEPVRPVRKAAGASSLYTVK